jgi:F0F1-type ATP synthase membrane subunit b/b'
MSSVSLIPSVQSDALVREIERQFAAENKAITGSAQRDAQRILMQARASARGQVHDAIEKLREEGARRLTRAKAQLETEARAHAQQQAAQAVRAALPLLHEALEKRWLEQATRQQWAAAVAWLCANRLPPGDWRIEHPRDWSAAEQKQFVEAARNSIRMTFVACDFAAGLRVRADQAVLDATPQGLLADSINIDALLLDEIGVAM